MFKDHKEVSGSETDITDTPEKAMYSKDGKVLCAFKASRDKFEKLVIDARENGTLPPNPLISEPSLDNSSNEESEDGLEIDVK